MIAAFLFVFVTVISGWIGAGILAVAAWFLTGTGYFTRKPKAIKAKPTTLPVATAYPVVARGCER